MNGDARDQARETKLTKDDAYTTDASTDGYADGFANGGDGFADYDPATHEMETKKIVADWTPAEEKKLLFKLDFIILGILTVAFFCMQMDRGNIGNAVTNDMLAHIGVSLKQYNVGQQLLYIGIVILEIPSNIILYKIGPRTWLGGQIVAWGLVELFQYAITGDAGFYVTRLFLGLCEAGFIPGALYCLSMWYKRSETSKRFAIFYFGNLVSQGATSLLAYGIFHMEGINGLHGWQWMFIIEGLFTILIGFCVILLLPKDPFTPYPLTRISYFTEREREIMWKRVILDDPSKEKKARHVSAKEFFHTLKTWRIYPHLLISLCGIAPVSTMLQYAPKLVEDLGYGSLKSNALVSIGGWLQIPVSLVLGIFSDLTRRRGIALLVGILFFWGFMLGNLIVRLDENVTLKFAILICTLSFCSVWQPINGSWLSLNSSTPAERSVSLAMFIMCTNMGGIIGSQLFQMDDVTLTRGWGAATALVSVSLLTTIFANVMYRLLNKKKRSLALTAEGEMMQQNGEMPPPPPANLSFWERLKARPDKSGTMVEIINGERVKYWL